MGVGQVGQLGVGLVGAGEAMAGSQMGQWQWGQGRTDDWEGWDGRVHEGQMAVAGGGGAGGPDSRCGGVGRDGREPDGAGAVRARRARWPTREEMAGYMRAR